MSVALTLRRKKAKEEEECVGVQFKTRAGVQRGEGPWLSRLLPFSAKERACPLFSKRGFS